MSQHVSLGLLLKILHKLRIRQNCSWTIHDQLALPQLVTSRRRFTSTYFNKTLKVENLLPFAISFLYKFFQRNEDKGCMSYYSSIMRLYILMYTVGLCVNFTQAQNKSMFLLLYRGRAMNILRKQLYNPSKVLNIYCKLHMPCKYILLKINPFR